MKMKIRNKKPISRANKIFTDREEPRAAFWKKYDLFKKGLQNDDGDIQVLSYYGIGGIGKSSLLKKLQQEISEKVPNGKHVYFDFTIVQESRDVLGYLRNKLNTVYGFKFPLFELGEYMYARKIGDKVTEPQIKGFIDRSPFLSAIIPAAGVLPLVGVTIKLMQAADKGVAVLRTFMQNHRQEVDEIEKKDANELYTYLPVLFAQDLMDNLKNSEEPLVVFFRYL